MSLRDEARALGRKATGPESTIMRLVDLLEGDERAEVISLIWDHDPDISHRAIADTLTRHYGARVGRITLQQVTNHRRLERPS